MKIYRVDPGTMQRTPLRLVSVGPGGKSDHFALSCAWPPCRCARCHIARGLR